MSEALWPRLHGREHADQLTRLWTDDHRVAPWRGTVYGVLAAANTYAHYLAPSAHRRDIDGGGWDPQMYCLARWFGRWETRRVVAGPQSHHLRLAGRADEFAEAFALIQAAAEGQAGALLISGEAGVGKTVLARAARSRQEFRVDVLWGSCLPLTSLAVPFLPLTTALREWAANHAEPVPLLRPSGETGSSDGPFEFDCWLASLCGRWSWSWTTCLGRIRAPWT